MFTAIEIIQLIAQGLTYKFYNDRYWRRLSAEIISENNGECELCKAKGKYSKAVLTHHVRHLKKYPHLAYSRYYVDKNGKRQKQLIAVCRECHERLHPERHRRRTTFTNQERW